MADDYWKLMCAGAIDKALAQMQQSYAKEPDASHVMELGVAYLWAKDYQAAWEHFDGVIWQDPAGHDIYYGMAGAAQWCLGRPDKAVNEWRNGLECEWVDVAGGISAPLLLFFASVMEPRAFSRPEAENLLRARAADGRTKVWPGPIAEHLLGQTDEPTFLRQCDGYDESDSRIRRWLAGFYEALRERDRGDSDRFAELMRQAAAVSDEDFDPAEPDYLTKLWHPELHLARYLS